MATWTTPRTWVVGEVATAAELNEQLRDNTTFLHSFHGCELYKTTDQTGIVDSTRTVVSWDGEFYDTDGFHDNATNNSRITIPTGLAGYYRTLAQVAWDSNATGQRVIVLRQNADNTAAGVQWAARVNPGLGAFTLSLIGDLFLNVGDYLELVAYQTSGGNRTIVAQNTWDGTNTVTASILAVQYLGI